MKVQEIINTKTEAGDLVWLFSRLDPQFKHLYGKALKVISVNKYTLSLKDPDGNLVELPNNKVTKYNVNELFKITETKSFHLLPWWTNKQPQKINSRRDFDAARTALGIKGARQSDGVSIFWVKDNKVLAKWDQTLEVGHVTVL